MWSKVLRILTLSAIIFLVSGKPVLAFDILEKETTFGRLEGNNSEAELAEPFASNSASWIWPFVPFSLPASWLEFLENLSQKHQPADRVEIEAAREIKDRTEIKEDVQTENKDLKTEAAYAEKQSGKQTDERLEIQPEKQEPVIKENAQAEKRKGPIDWLAPWKKTLELSYVVTDGNTLSSSFSFGSTLTRSPNEKDTYTLKTFLLRSHSTTITRRAVGTEENFTIEEERTRQLSAENYLLSGQYDRRVSGRLTTNLAFVWDRNKFSGVLSRALWTAGAGLVVADSARTKMRTQAGLSLTVRKYSQKPVNTFLGFRYALTWEQKLFDNASFATAFIFDDNLARISDWRYEWNFNVAAPLNKKLALKTGVRILRNNRPPDLNVPLLTPDGSETGLTVLIPRSKVDTFFTSSLVLNF
ncbi:MAG: DUF481 domain-containing protein [Candidatus Saccharicenans sp.]|uniref:DUF481 domain-containing protein n=1 Tax=Candidatus Saccharicenans sp. TaxID=2819258 RepID=UPI00404B41A2